MELDPGHGPVDLTDPESFAQGQPWESYRWLRENDPGPFPSGDRRSGVLGGYEVR
jgi:hypothetical protein